MFLVNHLLGLPQTYLTCPDQHHPHMIDLGLPSGTKWACCNVGAESPEDFGGYYSWGETEEKSAYNHVSYIHSIGKDRDGDGFYDDWNDSNGYYGTWFYIGDDISGTDYDVAHVKWGGSWVMPSNEQMEELVSNCTYKTTYKNYEPGLEFTGKNGGVIFFPLTGLNEGTTCYGINKEGFYWTSTVDNREGFAFAFHISEEFGAGTERFPRYAGMSVRPISK